MSTQLDIRRNQGSMLSVPDPLTGTGNVMRGTYNNPYQMNAVNAVANNNKGANMLPVIGGIAAGAGLLTSIFNRPKNMNQNFNFDLATPEYQTNENMLNAALAQRGAGNSFSSLLNASISNRGAEQMRKGFVDIMNRGVGYSTQFANLGLGAMQGATSAYGAGGQLSSTMDARQLQNQQFNADQRNNYNQYLKTANYNQSVQNRNAASAWRNNISNSLFNIAGSAFGMGG